MRIIAGKHKGLRLASPADDRVRPTTDRVRESLFAILGDFHDAIVVDGFAGTGALGCEALSRGAAICYFFDRAHSSIRIVEENVERIGALQRAPIYKVSFDRGLELLEDDPDLVFLDPPYGTDLAQSALAAMAESDRITAGAMAIVEQYSSDEPVQHAAFELEDERFFGDTRIRFLRRL